MTTPCRSDCPAGDCAGCAFPAGMAECRPSVSCVQARACARRQASLCSPLEQPVDGTVLKHSSGVWCPMFVDARGPLREAA